jgi:hypothetical protein
VDGQRYVDGGLDGLEALEVDLRLVGRQQVHVADGDREAVHARGRHELSGRAGVGHVGMAVIDCAVVVVGQAAEFRLDGHAGRVGGGHQLGHGVAGLRYRPPVAVDHHEVEPGIHAPDRLLERVGLVEQEGYRYPAAFEEGATARAEEFDAARVEPLVSQHRRAETDYDGRVLGLGRRQHGLERVTVPALEVAQGVAARARGGEHIRSGDQRHRELPLANDC